MITWWVTTVYSHHVKYLTVTWRSKKKIKGNIIQRLWHDDWVGAQDCRLEQCLALRQTDHIADTSEPLWTKFKTAFKSAWKDSKKKQSAYKQLMKLSMKDLDINSYVATFDQLAAVMRWEPDTKGTIKHFMHGLRDNIHRRVLSWNNEPTTMVEWQEAAWGEVHKVQKIISSGLNFRSKQKPCDHGPFQTSQTQCSNPPHIVLNNNRIVPMKVNATQTQVLFAKLTDEECVQFKKEGHCFRCRQKGHMARECLGHC